MKKTKSAQSASEKVSGDKSNHNFLVVGIGASAGGIKALKAFFAAMPADGGMAFVVILHLSQTHESNLAHILQNETRMRVEQVTETVKVEPNNVYVIPPARHLAMVDGHIKLTEPERIKGRRVPIDLFFRTLADAYGKNGIAVVLSGTGSDGTLGLKRVKENGGIGIAQEPAEAEYDGMPRSAINTGLVDLILPVAEIPGKLVELRDTGERIKLPKEKDEIPRPSKSKEPDALSEILGLVRVRTGHDFSNYKHATVLRRIARRLQVHGFAEMTEYLAYLREHAEEAEALQRDLLITVTNFFRDKEAFEILEREIIPKLFAGKTAADTVRVWSVGCATGEEAYSLAMLLDEYAARITNAPKTQVFASDINERAIAAARECFYEEPIVADVSPERLRHYFAKENGGYRVRKKLRQTVLFAPHNILRDPPFSRLDLIVCRNLLIYFNRETQNKVLGIFNFALRSDGFLFLGAAESAESQSALFSVVDKKQRIYKARPVAPHQTLPALPAPGGWNVKTSPPIKSDDELPSPVSYGEIHVQLVEQFAPPSVLVNEDYDIVHVSEHAARYLRISAGEPTRNLLKTVNPAFKLDLQSALLEAKKDGFVGESRNVRFETVTAETLVDITVRIVHSTAAAGFYLVIFEESKSPAATAGENTTALTSGVERIQIEEMVRQLENELQTSRERLRATIEQNETASEELKASNEELQAMNEEQRSTAEELETSKEELQSLNEELTTVNAELKDKVEETSRMNSDLQNLIQSTDIGTIFLDRALRIKRFTPRVTELFNLIPSDIGRPLEHITHRLEDDHLATDAGSVLQSLHLKEREVRGGADDSRYLVRIAPYRTLEDKIDGVVLSFQNITDLKRASDALGKSEERFSAIVNQTTAGMVETDLTGKIVLANTRFCDITGYTAKELLQMRLHDLVLREDLPESEGLFNRTTKMGEPFAVEERYVRKDGASVWVHTTVTAITGEDGKPKFVLVVALDISERKRAEESKQYLAAIVESADDAMLTVNFDGLITSWNTAAERLYGYSAAEAVGKPLTMLTLPEDLREVLANAERIKQGEIIETYETVRVHQGGRHLELEIVLSPVRDAAGKIIGVSTIARDISERKKLVSDLRASEETTRTSEDRARASEEKYRNLFNSIDEGFCVIKMLENENGEFFDWRYEETNPAFEKIAFPNAAGKTIRELFSDIEPKWFDIYGRVARTGEPVRLEEFTRVTNEWFSIYAIRVGAAGENRVAVVFNNITERKQYEQRLLQQSAMDDYRIRLNDALRPLSDAAAIQGTTAKLLREYFDVGWSYYMEFDDTKTMITVVSDSTRDGLPSMVGRQDFSDMPEFLRLWQAGQMVQVNDFHQSSLLISRAKKKYLASGINSFLGAPVLKNGVLIAALVLADTKTQNWSDIPVELTAESAERTWATVERARAEELLRESEEKYRSLFDSIDEGFCLIEVLFDEQGKAADYRFLEINPVFERQSGLENARDKTILELVPDLEPQWAETYGQVARTGEAVRFEADVHAMNRVFDIYAFPANAPDTVAVLFSDITERKRHEANLAFLAETSEDLVKLTNINETMNWLGAKIGEYFGLGHCLFFEIDEMEENVVVRYCWNRPDLPEIAGSFRIADFVEPDFAERSRAGKTIVARDLTDETVSDPERFISLGIRSFVAVPLIRNGKWRFTLGAYASEGRDWREDEIELMREITTRIWTRLERARAEEALRQKEAELEAIVGETPFMLARCTRDLRYRYVSRAYAEMLHRIPGEMNGNPIIEMVGEKVWNTIAAHVERVLQGERVEFETEVDFRDAGKPFFLHVAYTPDADEQGEVVGWFASIVDITQRKLAEIALRESEKRLRTLIENLPGGAVFVVDKDLRYLIAEGEALAGAGFSPVDLIGRTIREVMPPELVADYETLYRRTLAGEAFEHEHTAHDRTFVSRGLPLADAAGEIYAVLAISYDITDRKRAEESLRESEERLRLAVEAGELGTWDWNLATDEIFWNERHFILFGMKPRPNPLRAEEFFRHIHPEDAERVHVQLEKAVSDKTVFQTEFRAVTDAGEMRWMDGYWQTVETDRSGKTVRMSGVMFDVTDLKRAEDIQREKETLQKMIEAQEDERRRIAQDLHDHLGQQLTALRLKIESIKILCDGDEALCERVDETQAIARQIDADIDFLSWQMRPSALDDIGLAAALANYVREWSAQFNIAADFQVGRFGKQRLAEDAETHLYRIAQEALNNVFKHARATSVDVALERRDGYAVLIVEDDGIGFAQEDKQVPEKADSKRIGLVGMRERAAFVGGTVRIETAPGKGTTVFVRVPLSGDEKEELK